MINKKDKAQRFDLTNFDAPKVSTKFESKRQAKQQAKRRGVLV